MPKHVFLLPLVGLVFKGAVKGARDFVDALGQHVECTHCDCLLILLLLHFHMEVSRFSRTVNKTSLTLKETSLLFFSLTSICAATNWKVRNVSLTRYTTRSTSRA